MFVVFPLVVLRLQEGEALDRMVAHLLTKWFPAWAAMGLAVLVCGRLLPPWIAKGAQPASQPAGRHPSV